MQFIDLGRQFDTIEDKIRKHIDNVLKHKKFIMGPEIGELEKVLMECTGRKYAFTCSSGTDALVIPLMAYELTKEDAVFVPSFTFYASAESVNLAGGTPIFIDSDESYNIDPKELEKKIESVLQEGKYIPRGIIAVDIFGLPVDYDEMERIAKKYNLFLIEDAAQSFGAVYKGKKTCSFGDVSATSFFPAKPLGCYGDGGAIFTDNDELAEKISSIRVHGQGENRYDNVRIGVNGRLDTLQAAILLAKLEVLDDELKRRNEIAESYTEKLKDYFATPQVGANKVSAWAQFTLLAKSQEQRERIIKKLEENTIPIMIYYAIPMHLQKVYQNLGYEKKSLPICEDFSKRVFSIPMHPYLKEEEINKVVQALISTVGQE